MTRYVFSEATVRDVGEGVQKAVAFGDIHSMHVGDRLILETESGNAVSVQVTHFFLVGRKIIVSLHVLGRQHA